MNKLLEKIINKILRKKFNTLERMRIYSFKFEPNDEEKAIRITIDAMIPYSVVEAATDGD